MSVPIAILATSMLLVIVRTTSGQIGFCLQNPSVNPYPYVDTCRPTDDIAPQLLNHTPYTVRNEGAYATQILTSELHLAEVRK